MTFDAIILNSHVVLPNGIIDKNIVIDQGRIVGLTSDIPQCDKKIDAKGLVALPGLIDPHVHYGVYSPIEQAAVTESKVAAVGGVTTMMRMLRMGGSYKRELDLHLAESAKSHYVDYTVHASILHESQIDEMDYCTKKGISSFKLYMNLGDEVGHVYMDMVPGKNMLVEQRIETNSKIVEQVIANAAKLHCPVLIHAEDYQMCSCGIREAKEKKKNGLGAWSESRPVESEVKSITTASDIARKYGCTLYFVHIGSQAAMDAIMQQRKNGTKIFVETCPHYLTLSHESQQGYLAKVMPPIRSSKDTQRIWKEVQGGTIDTIGTDHVANQLKLKIGGDTVWDALAGFPGIGTLLPILLSEGVNKGRLSLPQLASLTSMNSAKIFGMYPKKGIIQKDSDADIVLVDIKEEKKASAELLDGFSDYTVYEGWSLKGWPVKTLVRGEVIAEDGRVVVKPGYGKFIPRNMS
ncbi:MAG TPA: amidohydrolase family protein [Candidatus Nitrosotalea sp.]|nr:amidohydrolase family protein [Candidatus Nitrosotalea sp.]